ncbi:MerR family transcriptional regulator [Actinomadura decatromicini]|uniref:MerR family transcriptional regulator n=1 Tax=Actinomadura decatromicini TaxID=2604572 RepID=A0A5D3FSV3_9ACTN|nr:MerR family transcriptional regulator [Actinomadura decatromicini]TYK51128.1 MerR family transcriptional regulator [Actinomadura decatromicini]
MDVVWTISELAESAAAALAADGSAQVSGRVRDLPNERLIRWYTTIGLVDPPLGRRGRTALYGPRHLLQLVAVKRRQAAGRSIAEIQLELAAATDATLERIAGLTSAEGRPDALPPSPALPDGQRAHATHADTPAPPLSDNSEPPPDDPANTPPTDSHTPGTPAPAQPPAGAASGATRSGFWKNRPDLAYERAIAATDDLDRPRPPVVQGVRLASGLTLLLDVPSLSNDDLAAIEHAARPLLDELHRRGLLTDGESLAPSPAFMPVDPSRRST